MVNFIVPLLACFKKFIYFNYVSILGLMLSFIIFSHNHSYLFISGIISLLIFLILVILVILIFLVCISYRFVNFVDLFKEQTWFYNFSLLFFYSLVAYFCSNLSFLNLNLGLVNPIFSSSLRVKFSC